MMSATELTNTSTITVSTRIRHQQIEPDINAFSWTSAPKLEKSAGDLKLKLADLVQGRTLRGYVDDRNLYLLCRGKAYRTLDLIQLGPEIRELVRTCGWAQGLNNMDRDADPFDAVADPDSLVRVDVSSYMLFDRRGLALPAAMEFDYISNGGITDGRYDLKRLAAHLLTRDDVWIYPRSAGWRSDQPDRTRRATQVEECITDIPYYNCDRGAGQTIYFRWMPSAGDYRKMWDHCVANCGKRAPSVLRYQAVFELDLLGARAAGAALFDDYYQSTRYGFDSDSCDD